MTDSQEIKIDRANLAEVIGECRENGGTELEFDRFRCAVSGGEFQHPTLFAKYLDEVQRRLPDLEHLTIHFDNLEVIQIFANKVSSFPSLQSLSLGMFGDDFICEIVRHPAILQLITSATLNTGDVGLTAIAAQARQCSKLKEINFCVCDFTDEGVRALASQAANFTSLETIADVDEDLTGFVTEEGAKALLEFTQLRILDISDERWPISDDWLKLLAKRAKKFSRLTDLNISYTDVGDEGVKAFAGKARHLKHLERLDIGGMRLGDEGVKAIADHSQDFVSLKSLSLAGSRASDEGLKSMSLAWQRGKLSQLEHFYVSHDQSKTSLVAPEILATHNAPQIFDAILNGITIPDVKMVVLGEPGVGKTSLCRRVFLNKQVDPARRRETHDFELIVPKWRPVVAGNEFALRVWDFGGQHVLHGTHEMFLTSRSVCVLVLDATQVAEEDLAEADEERNGNRLTYWLKMIRHFIGSDAQIIVVMTKSDRQGIRLESIDVEKFRLRYRLDRPIRLVESFSATDAAGRDAVRELQQEILSSIELLEQPRVTRGFAALKEVIEDEMDGRAMIGIEDYRRMCQSIGVGRQSDQDAHLRTLHHFGSVFYFGLLECDRTLLDERRSRKSPEDLAAGQLRLLEAERDPVLQRWLINPRWLKRPLYELIRESEGQQWLSSESIRKAAVRRSKQISLDLPHAAEDVVVAVLKLTELCFYDQERSKYFFPRGLSRDSGPFLTGWGETERHEVRWEWEFFPETVIHRFIVKAHQQREVFNRAQWRTGGVLQRGGTVMAIQGWPEEGRVLIWIKKRADSGASPSDGDLEYFQRIRARFCEIVGSEPESEVRSWGETARVESDTAKASGRNSTNEMNKLYETASEVGALSDRLQSVYSMYEVAAQQLENPTDQEAYNWIKDQLKGEGVDHKLLRFGTWSRYLRDARKLLDKSKNTPRRGRTGRSIVGENEI